METEQSKSCNAKARQQNNCPSAAGESSSLSFTEYLTHCWGFTSTETEKSNCLNNSTHQSMYLSSSCQQQLEVTWKRLWVTVLHVFVQCGTNTQKQVLLSAPDPEFVDSDGNTLPFCKPFFSQCNHCDLKAPDKSHSHYIPCPVISYSVSSKPATNGRKCMDKSELCPMNKHSSGLPWKKTMPPMFLLLNCQHNFYLEQAAECVNGPLWTNKWYRVEAYQP